MESALFLTAVWLLITEIRTYTCMAIVHDEDYALIVSQIIARSFEGRKLAQWSIDTREE